MLIAVLLLGLVGAACEKRNADRARSGPATPLHPCKVPGAREEVLCGTLTVYENRETRTGRTIDLNVVVLPALEPGGAKEAPLFPLDGGPGVAATHAAGFYAGEGKKYRRRRDVVLVDQRGTGKSNGLAAPAGTKTPQQFLTEMYPVAYVQELRASLEPRADLTQYTTSIAMDDLNDVRAWLGYEQIDLAGLSYGTSAALVYMRQHPTRVRAAVLMGVAPTDLKMPSHHARAAQRALELLLEDCSGDSACHGAFPELRREWEELLARLEREPARVEYSPPDQSGAVTVEIGRDIFAEKLRSTMYSTAGARQIPLIIHHAARATLGRF